QPPGRLRRRRVRGRRAPAARANRRRRRRGGHRQEGRDDVPPAVHRRWHPQLLLEGEVGAMSSHGIRDRVAIVGMGCTKFAEHFDKGADDLMREATDEAFAGAGVTKDEVDAYWLGTAQSGMSGITLARPLQLEGKPVT